MPLPWPTIAQVGGEMPPEDQQAIRELLDAFGERLAQLLEAQGIQRFASMLYRPFNLVCVRDAEKIMALFSPSAGGTADLRWIDAEDQIIPLEAAANRAQAELGWTEISGVALPKAALTDDRAREDSINAVAQQHFEAIERESRFARLGEGGLAVPQHLEPGLRAFLEDHPNPERNVFIMMRFMKTDQMDEISQAIRSALSSRGYDGIRSDDRDYTGDLWTNVEVCMLGCRLGVAVFEEIEKREFNPNVALELGYMMGRVLPADLIGRLYKPFDQFDITATIAQQIAQWIEIDLGVASAAS